MKYLFLQLLLIFSSCAQESGITRIWVVDDGEKIRKDDVTNPLASDPQNLIWDGETISLFGGRNEFVAFQLIIQADTLGASKINVSISDLKNGTSLIPGSATGSIDPFDYRERCAELFTEHYINIPKKSPPAWFFAPEAEPSDYYTGWIPDCLIPFSAPEGKGGAPFSIEPGMNQGVWIDIMIPENATSGIYSGELEVTESEKVIRNIPINLKVYDFTLPDSIHLSNMFGLYPQYIAQRHKVERESEEYFNLELKYFQMAHRHRFDLAANVRNLETMSQYYKRYYTGEAYTADAGYAGPGKNTGNITFSIGYGGKFPEEYGKRETMNRKDWQSGSDAWETWFRENAPGVKRHKYLFPDEPDFKGPTGKKGTGSMDTIKLQADWTHTNPGAGRKIPTLVTNKVIPKLVGYVDFWSISAEEYDKFLTPGIIASEKEKGHTFGIYNGFRPAMGAVITDAPATDFRVMPWIVWKYGLDQYFYWSVNFWTDLNIFRNPATFDNRINGDGTFLYPGEDAQFPEESRRLAGPLSSIRAKNWRRGEQDYEYLWLARKLGLQSEADEIVKACIPAALWDAKDRKGVSWPEQGYKFEEYRRKLAEMISGKSK
ncbi:MAG TPA: glycoside hydrolase domain-containing protein [Bacteroidales bacterium]|nr:glycoside hydrolase domain-containing protein [Bacteroidales bacterium]